MPELSVKTNQRGPYLTMVLTVIHQSQDSKEMKTECFNVCGLVDIAGKLILNENRSDVNVYIGVKKSLKAKAFTYNVSINISCLGTNRQLLCQDEWVEIFVTKASSNYVNIRAERSTYFGTIPVNISIHGTPILNSCVYQNLYEDTEFTCCPLQAEDGSIAVHKSVLLSHGDFFRTMLRGDWKETKEGNINMGGVTVQTLKHLKAYMYLGTLPEEGLEELLLLAKRCLMDNLATECITKIIKLVKPDSFDSLLEFACQNNMFDLVKAFLRLPDDKITQIEELDIQKKLRTSSNADNK